MKLTDPKALLRTAASSIALGAALTATAHAVPVRDDFDFDAPPVFDTTTDVTGVGQMIVWNGGGSVGTCTGTLVNPRMVIFAAHCVNVRPDSAYGAGGVPIGFGFRQDNLGPTISWLNAGFNTVESQAFYNVIDVITHPDNFTFLEADVAIATLDTPASNVPAWKLLFSPLTSQPLVHTNGYGATGNGSTGSAFSGNFYRRIANNQLGLLGSLDDIDQAFFGAPGGLPQDLYMMDFDDPTRTFPADFDIFPGDALGQEGLTGPGDSGGPLIVPYLYDSPVVAGVLSGGGRLTGQPFGSYGAYSFYQPLFMFANWIAENNPYVYAVTTGDGAWEDTATWTRAADPNLVVDDGSGNLVTFQPTTIADDPGVTGDIPNVGQICFRGNEVDGGFFTGETCVDPALTGPAPTAGSLSDNAGQEILPSAEVRLASGLVAGGDFSDSAATIDISAHLNGDQPASSEGAAVGVISAGMELTPVISNPPADGAVGADPAATFANSGAFVPENAPSGTATDPRARFYDVTIGHNITLNSVIDEIDRLTVVAGELDIQAASDLFVLVDTNVRGGVLNIDGTLITQNVLGFGGAITGDGNLLVNDFAGVGVTIVAPGAVGEIGNLTLASLGGTAFTALSVLAIDLGANQTSDLLSTSFLGLGANADLGGATLALNTVGGYLPRFGDSFRIVEGNSLSGVFGSVTDLPGVLFAQPIYTASSVDLRIEAASFASVASFTSPHQEGVAARLDDARSDSYAALADLYLPLDLLSGDALTGALENLAPHEHYHLRRGARAHMEHFANALESIVFDSPVDGPAGSGTAQAQFVRLASSDAASALGAARTLVAAEDEANSEMRSLTGSLRIFFNAGVLDADISTSADPLVDQADLEGSFGQFGADLTLTPSLRIGGAVGFASSDVEQALRGAGFANSTVETTQVTGYGVYENAGFLGLADLSFASHSSDGERGAAIGGFSLPTTLDQDADTLEARLLAAYRVSAGNVRVSPLTSLTWRETTFDAATGAGSSAAISLQEDIDSDLVGRLGLDVSVSLQASNTIIRPRLYAGLAKDFQDSSDTIFGEFASAPGTIGFGTGVGRTGDWFEAALGVSAHFDNGWTAGASYEIRDAADDQLESGAVSLALRHKF